MKEVYRLLLQAPVLGTMLYIVNSYVFAGDQRASSQFAPLQRWVRSLMAPVGLAALLGFGFSWPAFFDHFEYRSVFASKADYGVSPGELIHAVMPSLLGFGIGVYALLFALGAAFVAEIQGLIDEQLANGKRNHGSVMLLSADMAYPLTVLIVVIGIGAAQRAAPEIAIFFWVTWTAFWYGLIVSIELIGVLFGLGNKVILDRLEAARARGEDQK